MARSAIDIVSEVALLIDKPALHQIIGENHVWQHNWPLNTEYTEVAVSLPTTDAYESELRFFDVEIRTPNLKNLEIYDHQDDTFPDLSTLDEVVKVILDLLQSAGNLYLQVKIPGVPKRDKDGVWYASIRVEFTWLDEADTHVANIYKLDSQPDGFGGAKPVRTLIWEGNAQRVDIIRNPNLSNTFGAYEMNMKSSWLVPTEAVTPTKDTVLTTDEGEYTITAIFPSVEFWRLSTTRKDGNY